MSTSAPPLPCKPGEWTELFKVDASVWFSALWADRPDDIFVAGKFKQASPDKNAPSVGYTPSYEFPIYHFDGYRWQKHTTPAASRPALRSAGTSLQRRMRKPCRRSVTNGKITAYSFEKSGQVDFFELNDIVFALVGNTIQCIARPFTIE